MAHLYRFLETPRTLYSDKKYKGGKDAALKALETTTTLYVGNLAQLTREEQVFEVFSKCGEIRRIIMGLDRMKRTPCGFCFVEFCRQSDARVAVACLDGSRLDERTIRVDWDPGFQEGRQFGRGIHGGQVRDDFRDQYDPGRGKGGAGLTDADRERLRSKQDVWGKRTATGDEETRDTYFPKKRRRE